MGKSLRSMASAFSAALLVSALAVTATGIQGAAEASSLPSCSVRLGATHVGRFLGILRPQPTGAGQHATCRAQTGDSPTSASSPPYYGDPPLLYHAGGPVMATSANSNKLVVTPIFWAPSGYTIDPQYESIIEKFLTDIAASSTPSDVFGTLQQYYDTTNGHVHASFSVGTPILATNAFPTEGCTPDPGQIYSDDSGYSYCLTDSQLRAEVTAETSSLPADMGHIYPIFTPKGIEVCFTSQDGAQGGECTISPSAASAGGFCAYHSAIGGTRVYAAMPYPIYQSPQGFTCGTDAAGLPIESPNGNADADTEISPLSHEMAESMTDPTASSWYDAQENEVGDDCAYIYGSLSGTTAGQQWNQTINGDNYIVQEEFSDENYLAGASGCVQGATLPVADFSVTTPSPTAGQPVAFSGSSSSVPVPGGPYPPTITSYSWNFGDGHSGTGETPSHTFAASGHYTVSLQVTDSDGWSSATYQSSVDVGATGTPTITSLSPVNLARGVSSHKIVVKGSGFVSGATLSDSEPGVTFASAVVNSTTQITAKVSIAKTAALGHTSVSVKNPGSAAGTCTDCLTIDAKPTISSLSLTKLAAGKTTTVTVHGSGFETGARLAFSASGMSVTIVSVSATAIKVKVKVGASAAHTYRSLTLTNPDGGSATKSDAVKIT